MTAMGADIFLDSRFSLTGCFVRSPGDQTHYTAIRRRTKTLARLFGPHLNKLAAPTTKPRSDAARARVDVAGSGDAAGDEISESEVERIKQALDQLSHDRVEERADWIKIGMALKSRSPQLFSLWDRWSSAGSSYPGTQRLRQIWDGFEVRAITLGTLFYFAQQDGDDE